MTAFEHLSSNQKIRVTLHRDVQAICTETCHFLGMEISKPAMEIVAELVYKKLSVYGTDLEAFAKHAKRTTVTTEDVKLLVRRCPSLKTHLNTISPTVSGPTPNQKKRKTIAGRPSEAPTPKAKESEILISKSKELESFLSKKKDIETLSSKKNTDIQISKQEADILTATSKKEVKMDVDVKQKEDSMIMDDLIDLTFD